VQQVNLLIRVFNKTGVPLTAPFSMGSLFAPLGGLCATDSQTDPVVLYDPLADRWLLSQFAFVDLLSPPYYECIAISQTSDPTGAYFLYQYLAPGSNLPDYPKLGVWPDAYYMTTNQFFSGGPFTGTGAFAFDRAKMLIGDPSASFVYFDLNLVSFPEGIGGMLPSDLDGLAPPPVGAPNVFAYFLANEFGNPIDGLRLFEFRPNFVNPAASTFTERADSPLPVAAFNPLSPPGRDDIEQPPPASAAASLDAISDRLMHRLAYRNFGTHESLVVNHTVNVGTGNTLATHQAGVRYYELRKSGAAGAFVVHEQATFAPDADNRWMGSAAMDHQGNIAVGYSVSGLTVFPSIRYAGRLAADPPGGLFQGETTLIAGSGVQRATGSRWGDYSAMSVDPTDDCTFWFTSEYYTAASEASSLFGWLTRIGSFPFPSCTPISKGMLRGLVTDAATGAPIAGALVRTSSGFSRLTDTAGGYSMTLAPDTVDMTVSALGYMPASTSVTVAGGAETIQNFALLRVPVIAPAGAVLTKESCSLNRVVDPHETVTAEFSLKNVGLSDAVPLFAALEESGGVAAPSAEQSYGILQAGGSPVSRMFTFTANASCGGVIVATLRLRVGEILLGGVSFTFEVGSIAPIATSATYSSGDLSAPINDFSTVEIPITVPDLGIVEDVNVRIRLNHTFDGDLSIGLIGPDGTTVDLSSNNGGGGDDFGSGPTNCSGQPTIFDDAALRPIVGSAAPFAGAFRPEQFLAAFNGRRSEGVWRLRVRDGFAQDQGVLFCVQLEINRRARLCCTSGGTPSLIADTATVRSENFGPANNAPDPDETVTVDFGLRNIGSSNTSNRLVATLLPGGGVSSPSPATNYGELQVGGAAEARAFTFTARGACGETITPTLRIDDAGAPLGTVTYRLMLGALALSSSNLAQPGSVTINDLPRVSGVALASPYPSAINVSGLAGTVTKVTVTLTGLSHTFPSDVDILLVGPGGQTAVILSDVGDGIPVVGANITLDDAAASNVPSPLVSGSFRPTNLGVTDVFPAPAPPFSVSSALAVFNGTNPNGAWRLFVVDDVLSDSGEIAGGWSLTITTGVPVCVTH
jgi:subtilisin-like proprotein convertase family protein